MRAYDEIVNFIAAGSSAHDVASFKPSPDTRQRVAFLLDKEKNEGLSEAERYELQQFMQVEHLMRLAKARAKALTGA